MTDLAMQVAAMRAPDIDAGIFAWNGYDTVDFRLGYRAALGDTLNAGSSNGGAALPFVSATLSGIGAGTYAVPPPIAGLLPSADYKAGYKSALADCSAAAAAGQPPPAPSTLLEPDGANAPASPPDVPITSP